MLIFVKKDNLSNNGEENGGNKAINCSYPLIFNECLASKLIKT